MLSAKRVTSKPTMTNSTHDDLFRRLAQDAVELGLEVDVSRPWGGYITFARNEPCTPKLLILKDELSVQSHEQRDERWCLVARSIAVYRGDIKGSVVETIAGLEEMVVSPGGIVYIPRRTVHTAANRGDGAALIVEVAYGVAIETDIRRYYDKNGRVTLEGYPAGIGVRKLIALCRERLKR